MSSDYRKKNDDTENDMSGIIIEDNDVKVTGRADEDTVQIDAESVDVVLEKPLSEDVPTDADMTPSHTAKLQMEDSEDAFEQAAKDTDSVSSDENNSEDTVRRKKREVHGKKKKVLQRIGWGVALVQVILSVVLMVQVSALGMIPEKYLVAASIVLLVLAGLTVVSTFFSKTIIPGWIFGALIIIVAIFGCVYLARTQAVLEEVTVDENEEVYKVDSIVLAVLADDQAQTMDDAVLYNFGIHKTLDRDNTDTVIAEIEANAGIELTVTEYDDFSALISDLKSGAIQAMIYNSAFNDTIEETDENFSDEVRILDNHSIQTKVNLTASDMNLTKEPFTVYISGIDVYGEIGQTSRSDVNMLVTVNPVTKEVLMTTTPRDYYVTLPNVSGDSRDKLTHAGIYGINCSMDTLSQIYGIRIDYYVRVNFDTLKKVVNALGGVDVYSEYEFTTHYKNGGYEIKKGYNHMDGKTALAFARERYNVPGGDEQRGRDQQAVLKAILEKAMSPSILTGYMGLMDSLSGSFETNMSMNQIASVVKMQLADGASWDIKSQSVTGTFGNEACYSTGWQRLSIMFPDEASVYVARKKILAVGGVALAEDDPLYRTFDVTDEDVADTESTSSDTQTVESEATESTDTSGAAGDTNVSGSTAGNLSDAGMADDSTSGQTADGNQTTTSVPETVVNEDAQLDIDASSGTLAYPSFWTGFWTGMQTTEE